MKKLVCLILTVLAFGCASESNLKKNTQVLWKSGENGYHTFRIPAINVTTKGTVLAFCEGRKQGRGDTGDIDMLVKRSTDNGKTWSEQQVIWDDGDNVCGNPCPITDTETGTIWLLMTWNRGDDHEKQIVALESKDTRRVYVTSSTDDGLTWAEPVEITSDVKDPNWTWYATGPGCGLQIENGPNKGRLVVPCDHIEADTKNYYSHIFYSDDHGKTWQLGGSTPQDQVNECLVAELPENKLLLNMRNYDRTKKNRQLAFSDDGGLTWTDQKFDTTLIEPICQAGFKRYSWAGDSSKSILLFSNPACDTSRIKMTIRKSYDEGNTWPEHLVLNSGPSAYSDITVTQDSNILCLYEAGIEHPYETIVLANIKESDISTK